MNVRQPVQGILLSVFWLGVTAFGETSIESDLQKIGCSRGIVAVLEVPNGDVEYPTRLARDSELVIYVQSSDLRLANEVRRVADANGLLGRRIFVSSGPLSSIHLTDNLVDCIWVSPLAKDQTPRDELLRVLRPGGKAMGRETSLVKPISEGIDEWTHPYHGPDNNPQSSDRLVRGAFRTQFLGYPKFSPMPEQSVVGGGRIYKAMGHIAHKANQNEMLNTLLAINAYNGTILWKRPLSAGFMLHRNTMIATHDALYLGDHESCKVIDGQTGEVRDELTIPADLTDGPVWKWMAQRDGVLYALLGNPEIKVDTQRSTRRGLGHWPWGMWKGHDYNDPRTAFGFGRTLVAIDLQTKQIRWHYRDDEFLDARAVCMNENNLYCFCPDQFLACIDVRTGSLLWKNSDQDLLQAIGSNARAQHYITGYATTCYMKCTDEYLFFAGPQRERLVVASALDGKLAWTHPTGNLQLVLREDAVWAAGPQKTKGMRFDYATGNVLDEFPARRACTRATGCADSIFYRASGGTVRVLTETNTAQHIAPMRPPCQDGVLISNGHLYWGPWMCGCQLSFYGNICLRPTESLPEDPSSTDGSLWIVGQNPEQVEPLAAHDDDWPVYRANNARTDVVSRRLPTEVEFAWQADASNAELPTAPIAAGGLVFVADRAGAVRAIDGSGKVTWTAFTGGPIYYPPALAHDRLYVGSADGRVYAFEARSGRLLWSHQVAPLNQWLSVYGKLISTWPVAGGVVVDDDTVYAAAGIAHYDGTYVVALDAVTGQRRAYNGSSGTLAETQNNGISMQGNLRIANGELQFLAGGVYEVARYDLTTLRCLNTPKTDVTSQFRTAFYPYYPEYGKYVSLEHDLADGHHLVHDASYEGSRFTNLSLHEPLPEGTPKPRKEAARWIRRRGGEPPQMVWEDKADRRFTSFVVAADQILAVGHSEQTPEKPFLALINIKDGTDSWLHELPALAVKGGTAIDREGNIYVTLETGALLCYQPK